MRLIVGISGSSRAVYGIRLLEALREIPGIETQLVMTANAKMELGIETGRMVREVEALANEVYDHRNLVEINHGEMTPLAGEIL